MARAARATATAAHVQRWNRRSGEAARGAGGGVSGRARGRFTARAAALAVLTAPCRGAQYIRRSIHSQGVAMLGVLAAAFLLLAGPTPEYLQAQEKLKEGEK